MCELLTECEVKIDVYWLFCVLMDRDEVHKLAYKRLEEGQYSAILSDRTSFVNEGFIVWKKKTLFSSGIQRFIPNGRDSPIFPARVANQGAEFRLSFPITELAIHV